MRLGAVLRALLPARRTVRTRNGSCLWGLFRTCRVRNMECGLGDALQALLPERQTSDRDMTWCDEGVIHRVLCAMREGSVQDGGSKWCAATQVLLLQTSY